MFKFDATVLSRDSAESRSFPVARLYNLGSATREPAVAAEHQHEVARAGIQIAYHVPAPRIYPIDTFAITTGHRIGVQGPRTSGEVEIVLVMADRLYVGVGSDHTERDLERTSIVWSKQACPNVLAPTLWVFDEIADHWDDCVIRSSVDGHPYQDVSVSAFLSPHDVLRILRERVPTLPGRDFVVFCGTIVALRKELGFGENWEFEMHDPVLGRHIRHAYKVEQLFDDIAAPYRVPLISGSR